MDFLQEYTEKVFSGEIVAGTELKRMLKMLQADRESGEYIFDTGCEGWSCLTADWSSS